MNDDFYFTTSLRKGHGLPHNPFNAIVGPRPIGWISTRGSDGVLNLAPYSFFNAFAYTPPIVGFASSGAKDTLRNVRDSRRVRLEPCNEGVGLADESERCHRRQGRQRVRARAACARPVHRVAAPRVAESPVSFECKVTQILQLTDHAGTGDAQLDGLR